MTAFSFFVDRSKKGVRGVPDICKTDCRLRCWHFLKRKGNAKKVYEQIRHNKRAVRKNVLVLGDIWVLFRLK